MQCMGSPTPLYMKSKGEENQIVLGNFCDAISLMYYGSNCTPSCSEPKGKGLPPLRTIFDR
uniref:Uncharacterized protein n=1 Tax=Utricularia reniformis TaxID=192314 RepID=A0A1Y0B0E4_9LAMI|nr:hypothetical protein AEK19_MT0649 [Utricularia reniformis]ART30902.1 hypothetical protein AEK19_MT0649 [Utricularia reniformis]